MRKVRGNARARETKLPCPETGARRSSGLQAVAQARACACLPLLKPLMPQPGGGSGALAPRFARARGGGEETGGGYGNQLIDVDPWRNGLVILIDQERGCPV